MSCAVVRVFHVERVLPKHTNKIRTFSSQLKNLPYEMALPDSRQKESTLTNRYRHLALDIGERFSDPAGIRQMKNNTPITLRPTPRAILDWLALIAVFASIAGGLWVFFSQLVPHAERPAWQAVALILLLWAGMSWLTDWKHRASLARERARFELNR